MTVKTLKLQLNKLPDDMEIIIQKDAEGNGYSPLFCADSDCIYVAEQPWYGTVYDLSWTAEDADMEPAEWEKLKKEKERVLVLVPVN